MSEQVGRDPQGLNDDNADVMEDAHHITMQPTESRREDGLTPVRSESRSG
ncbi:hypothetical protein [Sinorhizobium meliloti]|nr:hypothetical protein [Sinorhizobium meliloti]